MNPSGERGTLGITSFVQQSPVVSKFSCGGRGIRTGVPYDQDYISVATFKGSRIQQ